MSNDETYSKSCFKCGEVKTLSDFYAHKRMADGHLNKCKECTKRDTKLRFDAKREEIREYDRDRQKKPERRANQLEYQRRSRLNNPEKYKARMAVGNAVRDGRLKPRPCEVCGALDVQAHHEDYSKPLDVRWMCFKHHRSDHGQTVAEDTGNVPCFSASTDPSQN